MNELPHVDHKQQQKLTPNPHKQNRESQPSLQKAASLQWRLEILFMETTNMNTFDFLPGKRNTMLTVVTHRPDGSLLLPQREKMHIALDRI